MRHCNTAGLLGVIIEVSLSVHVCVITDDLDRVLVSTYSTISSKSPELAVCCSLWCCNKWCTCLKRKVCNIINDTDCEFLFLSVLIYCYDLCRCCIFGTKSVTSCKDLNIAELAVAKSCNNIKIQRLAKSSWLFCSVKNRDLLNCIRDCIDKSLCTEWSVKTNFNNTDFLTSCHKVIDCLLDGIVYGTHSYDDVLSVSSSVVVEQFVVCSDLLVNFVHILLNNCRKSVIIWITCLSCLEEDIRVLSGTSLTWMVRIQSTVTELCDCVHICHIFQIFIVPCLDLLDLMRCTESVEEVDERNFSFDCCKMSNRCKVHNLLYRRLTKHCTSSLTTGHNVGMVTENTKCVGSKCTGRYVDNSRKLLTSNLVKVRDHKQKTLGSCVGCSQGTCCQRTVNCTCCTSLRLHLCNLYFLSKDVLSSLSCPLICCFRHNR